MKKKPRGTCDVVNGRKSNIILVRWKDNKVVTALSTAFGKEPIRKANCYIKERGGRVETNQPNTIAVYNKTMGRVDQMDQNISAYMINICNKKWCWPLLRFCIDLAVNNAHQLYCLQPLQPGQRALDLLGFQREIVQVYCSKYQNVRKILRDIFPAPQNHQKVIPDIRYDNESHWIIKGKQRRCTNCSKTSI